VGLTTLPCKKKIVEKPPRNSAGFCGGGQGLSWAVEPRKEKEEEEKKCSMIGPLLDIKLDHIIWDQMSCNEGHYNC
jgi:hypothetical protein